MCARVCVCVCVCVCMRVCDIVHSVKIYTCTLRRLTAFVVRSLSDVHTFYGEQSFIDAGVLRSAFNYIVSSQQKNGSFKRIGYTTNYRLLVRQCWFVESLFCSVSTIFICASILNFIFYLCIFSIAYFNNVVLCLCLSVCLFLLFVC